MIIKGDMTDMSWISNTGYVLDNGNGRAHVVELDKITQRVTKISEIALSKYDKDYGNTLQVTPDFIAIAQYENHCIRKYTHQGQYQYQHMAQAEQL